MSKLNASCLTEKRKTERGERKGFAGDEHGFRIYQRDINVCDTLATIKWYVSGPHLKN
jgi:hypothetical protein